MYDVNSPIYKKKYEYKNLHIEVNCIYIYLYENFENFVNFFLSLFLNYKRKYITNYK